MPRRPSSSRRNRFDPQDLETGTGARRSPLSRAAVHFGLVGADGIRRRRVVRHLPPVRDEGERPSDEPPPLMWPEAGSGFEADPFSPAGQAQAMWRFLDGIRSQRGRGGPFRLLSWVIVILVFVPVTAAAVLALVHLVVH